MVGSLIAAELVAAGTIGAGFAATATAFAVNFAVSQVLVRTFAQDPSVGQQQDNGVRQQIPPSSTNSIPIVYGDAYLGGTFVDAVLTDDQKTMYYVMAVSCVSPNGQFSFDTTKFYYGDRLVTFKSSGNTNAVASLTDEAGNVDTAIADGDLLQIYLYQSNASGTITGLNTSSPPSTVMGGTDIASTYRWPSSGRQMNGLAFAIIKLKYSRDAQTTQLEPITFKCSQYLNSTGVAKPGDVWYDYMTSTVYGAAAGSTYVDSASATALNTYSDQTIAYTPSGGGSATQARYRINGVLNAGETVLNNLDRILTACDSWMAYQAATGQWSIVINKAESSSYSFDDTNIIGEIRVSATDITNSVNQIEAKFPFKENRDQPEYVNLQTPSGLLYPNEPVNKYTTSFDVVNDSVQATYLANRILEQAREDLIVSFSTTYYGIQVDAGNVVSVTNDNYGWSGKLFRVMKVNEVSLPDGTLGARLELNEYNAQVYDDASITQFTPIPNSGLSNPNFFSTLSAPTTSNSQPTATIPSFHVNTVMPATGRVTQVILFYTNVSTPSATDWLVWGSQVISNSTVFTPSSTVTFTDVQLPADTYYFAFKVLNENGNSPLSTKSTAFSWSPNPTTTAVAGTFLATFQPTTMQVPRTGGTPTFTGLIAQLTGTAAGGAIEFVTSQTDSDAAFVNNTWRIGASSTTGNGDITASNITLSAPTDGGTYAQWAAPSAMSSSPATLTVPVRYKSALGVVSQGANAILQYIFVDQGTSGYSGAAGAQYATVYLYQWSTSTPGNPSGNTTYTWATGSNTSYTGGNGWQVAVPSNPGTPGIYLWIAQLQIAATAGTLTTTVSWSSGYSIQAWAGNGASGTNGASGYSGINGVKTAVATVYQWAVTIPSGPTGTSTYTWSSSSFTPNPSGWTTSISTAPSPGYTLWAANVQVSDTASATTTTINWSTASIISAGYAGDSGYSGYSGASGVSGFSGTGTAGASARVCYADVTGNSLNSTPATVTTSGSTSFPPTNSWGGGEVWVATPPTIVAGHALFQSDGIYNPATGNTVWNVPYLSSLKVGSLSAISANLGNITAGDLQIGSSPAISGTTMTGSGTHVYSDGRIVSGNSQNNLVFDGTTLYLNLPFLQNPQTISQDATVDNSSNALSVGPITVATGVSITVPTGSVWTVV